MDRFFLGKITNFCKLRVVVEKCPFIHVYDPGITLEGTKVFLN